METWLLVCTPTIALIFQRNLNKWSQPQNCWKSRRFSDYWSRRLRRQRRRRLRRNWRRRYHDEIRTLVSKLTRLSLYFRFAFDIRSYQAVESMRLGMTPTQAAEDAIRRIAKFFPTYKGALITLNKNGQMGAAAHGWVFKYAYQNSSSSSPQIVTVQPIPSP